MIGVGTVTIFGTLVVATTLTLAVLFRLLKDADGP